ncbi:hypothetical protein Kpho02_44170 [Kitasatospora phosalacinea]|uniref:Uncharacterized protein n=1 Tax=Kitasatospora phosalacinea TaxID=2065 RepID=A0A9W6QBS7_9ACTN|nr:hypothetical protein Kpho02_44170 [Kitasatospora phosalacinea]
MRAGRDREDDAAFGADYLGGEGCQASDTCALGGAADAGRAGVQVEVFPAQAEEFALAQAGAESEFEQRVEAVALGGSQGDAGLVSGQWVSSSPRSCPDHRIGMAQPQQPR